MLIKKSISESKVAMNWKRWAGLATIFVLGFGAYRIWLLSEAVLLPSTEEEIASVRAVSAAQDEGAFFRPENQPLEVQPTNPLNNVYFGDLHIHTSISSDAYLFGNRLDMDTAYRFAKGESGATLRTGEYAEISRPLDFAALTDHAETFGRRPACESPDASDAARAACNKLEAASMIGFLQLRQTAQPRPPVRPMEVFNNNLKLERSYAAATW